MQSIRSVDSQIAVKAPIYIFKCCFIGRYASKVPGISTASSSIGRSISVTISPLVKDKIGEPTFCGFCKTSADRNSHSVVQYKFRSVKIACVIKINNYSTVAHKKSFVAFKLFAELGHIGQQKIARKTQYRDVGVRFRLQLKHGCISSVRQQVASTGKQVGRVQKYGHRAPVAQAHIHVRSEDA